MLLNNEAVNGSSTEPQALESTPQPQSLVIAILAGILSLFAVAVLLIIGVITNILLIGLSF